MLTIYRRHRKACKHRAKGRKHRHCHCPIWVDGFLSGQEIRESLKIRDWQRAQELIRDWEIADRRTASSARKAISEGWQEFLVDIQARNLHESTIRKYKVLERQTQSYAKERGIQFLDEFTLPSISHFRSTWQDAPRTSAKKLERLRSFFDFALKRKWVPDNPATELKPPKITLCPTLPFTREEMRRIVAAVDTYEDEIDERGSLNAQRLLSFVLLLRYAGVRIGDITRLRRDQVQGNKLFLYTQKTGVAVNTILPNPVAYALERIPTVTATHFFWDGRQLIEITIGSWRRRLAKLFELATVTGGHPHRFRDTCAVELLLTGVPIERVSILLGHQSVRITEKHYAPWVRSRQEQLEADLTNAWKQDPELVAISGGHERDTRKLSTVSSSFYDAILGGAGGNRTQVRC
jgi:integrase/recombinase XerD